MDRLIKWFTVGRAIAAAIAILTGGIGTGIGFLLGEGEARATMTAKLDSIDKRLTVIEGDVVKSVASLKEVVAELKGELRAMRKGKTNE